MKYVRKYTRNIIEDSGNKWLNKNSQVLGLICMTYSQKNILIIYSNLWCIPDN